MKARLLWNGLHLHLNPKADYRWRLALIPLKESDGGMILGSITRHRNGHLEVRAIVGCRLIDEPTALKLIEIANGEGENEDA